MPPEITRLPRAADAGGHLDLAQRRDGGPVDAAMRAMLLRDKAPTTREASTKWVEWSLLKGVLGQPFDNTSIPLSKLEQMRRDPMIAFGLMFCKVPLVRARWFIRCADPAKAAFIDGELRKVWGRYVLALCNDMDYGYSPVVKRFDLDRPQHTYIETGEDGEQERLAWDKGVDAIVWKPFVPLNPSWASAAFTKQGEFNGIHYRKSSHRGFDFSAGDRPEIPLEKALWSTNEKDTVFGNLYGYPRTGYAYRYWWSYWYRWALADRAFERFADPAIVVYHPPQPIDDETGEEVDFSTLAIGAGEDVRSGDTVALPNSMVLGTDGQGKGIREWEITQQESKANFDALDQSFEYLDVQKLRALMIPEQSLVEGKGGCVAAGTPIAAPRDHQMYPDGVPIEQMRKGQLLWSMNEDTGRFELARVKDVWCTQRGARVMRVTFDDGSSVRATADHPFMLRDGSWRMLVELRPGDSLMPLNYVRDSVVNNRKREHDFEPWVMVDPDRPWRLTAEYHAVGEHLSYDGSLGKIDVHHRDRRHANSCESNLEKLHAVMHGKEHGHDWTSERRTTLSESVKAWWRDNRELPSGVASLEGLRRGAEFRKRMAGTGALAVSDETRAKLGPVRTELHVLLGCQPALQALHRPATLDRELSWTTRDPSSYTFKMKGCARCQAEFTPRSSRNVYCADCVPPERTPYLGRIKRPRVYAEKRCVHCDMTFAPRSGNQKQCDECLFTGAVNHTVVSIEDDGVADVWDIHVDGPEHLRNFVAGGVVVHNTSSRNVAATFGEAFQESMAVKMAEIIDQTNRFVIPQLGDLNYGADSPRAELEVKGFDPVDVETMREVVRLVGQTDPTALGADLRAILEFLGIPQLSVEEISKQLRRAQEAAADRLPPPTDGDVEQAGVTEEGLYYRPRESITLDLAQLPPSRQFEDPTIISHADELKGVWEDEIAAMYEGFAQYLERMGDELKLSEADEQLPPEALAKRLVERWRHGVKRTAMATGKSVGIIGKIVARAAERELRQYSLSGDNFSMDNPDVRSWIDQQGARLVRSVGGTVRRDLRTFLKNELAKNKDPRQIARAIRSHFREFPGWKSDRVARTETRDAYNGASLLGYRAANVSLVQAFDAAGGFSGETDPECLERNGKVFTIDEAMREDEHPNGTLGWRPILDVNFSVESVPQSVLMTNEDENVVSRWDPQTSTLLLAEGLGDEDRRAALLAIGERLSRPTAQKG